MCGTGRLVSDNDHLIHGSQTWCDEYFIATTHLIIVSIDNVVYGPFPFLKLVWPSLI